MRGRYGDFPCTSCPHTFLAFPIINTTHENDRFFFFFTGDKPILIHHNHLKYIMCHRVHCLCCTFYGFGETFIHFMYKWHLFTIISYIDYFPCLKNTLYSTCLSLLLLCLSPWTCNHLFFSHLRSFAFSRMSYGWNHTICSLFRLAYFT